MEIFDSLEYEAIDKAPEEWLAVHEPSGYCPYYQGGKWLWRKVEILGLNQETGKFSIRFNEEGTPKDVHRLNLRMNLEDEKLFEKRRETAEGARADAKKIMRFDHFVHMQPKESIRAIRRSSLKKVHERIVSGIPSDCPLPEPNTFLGNLLKQYTGEMIHWYSRTMKKIVVHCKLRGVSRDENMCVRYQLLNLPDLPPVPHVPYCGKLACPEYPFEDRMNRMSHMHISCTKEVISLHKWIYDMSNKKFSKIKQVEMSPKLAFPCQLEDFKNIQVEKSESGGRQLKQDLRRAFSDQFTDHIQDVYDFFQSNVTVYKNGALYKLFRATDLRIIQILRTIFTSELQEWCDFVIKNTKLLDFTASSEHPATARVSEMRFPIDPREPYFQAELKLVDHEVVLEPSSEAFVNVFISQIDRTVDNIKSLTTIDKDIMSLMVLDSKTWLPIGQGNPLCSDLDNMTTKTKQIITSSILAALKRPMELVSLYQEYCWLLAEDIDEYLEKFAKRINVETGDLIPYTLEEYSEELKRIETALKGVLSISYENENFGFVTIKTGNVNDILAKRAIDLRNGLLEFIRIQGRMENEAIVSEYKSILERISIKPANEQALADLRDFIVASRTTVEELQQRVEVNRALLGVLDVYNIPLPPDDMAIGWTCLEYPSTVDHSGKEVEITLDADKARMMDRLEIQKNQFEGVVEDLAKQVKEMQALTDYDDKEKIAESINNLDDKIKEAKETGADFNMREQVFGYAPTDYTILDKYTENMAPFYKLWNMCADFHNAKFEWLHGAFKELDGAKIEADVTEWWKTSYKLAKSLDEDFPGAAEVATKLRQDKILNRWN